LLILSAGLGFLCHNVLKLPKKLFDLLHRVNTLVLLPVYLFLKVCTAQLEGVAGYSEALLCMGLIYLLMVTGSLWLHRRGVPGADVPVLIQTALRGSSTLYTVALVLPLLPEALQGYATVSVSLFSTITNLGFIFLFAIFCRKGNTAGSALKRILLDPVLLAVLLGLVLCFGRISLPTAVTEPLDAVSSLCAPLSFFLMGSMLSPDKLTVNAPRILHLCAIKLLALPVLGLLIGALLGFRGNSLLLIAVFLSAPVSSAGFALARHTNADSELAGKCTLLSSLLAPFTASGLLLLASLL